MRRQQAAIQRAAIQEEAIQQAANSNPPAYTPGPGDPPSSELDKSQQTAAQPQVQMSYDQTEASAVAPQRNWRPIRAIPTLRDKPAYVNCPACRQTAMTKCEYTRGRATAGWEGLLTLFCLCLVPTFTNFSKDCISYCGNCGACLASFDRSLNATTAHVRPVVESSFATPH